MKLGFEIHAESIEAEQRIAGGDILVHNLMVELLLPSDQIGSFVVEFR